MSGPGYSETYTNDAYGRLKTQAVSSDASYQVDLGYNALGTLDTLTYPTSTSGYRLKLQYDYTNGLPTAIKDFNAPTTVIWSRTANDARGDVIDETLGSNLKVVTGRDPLTGRMDYRQAGVGGGSGVQNLAYLYDVNDNLSQRGDANQTGTCSVGGVGSKLCETFTYDSLDRLDTVRRNGTLTLDANYDLSGNLTSRSDVGTYTYHATRKHAVTAAGSNSFAYDANGNVITRNGATLGWASYDLPTSLASGGNTASFAYTPERARWRQIAVTAGVTETTIYVAGVLEKVTKPSVTLWKHYVASPTGMGAVYVRRSDGTSDTYYLTTDQLGSTDRILKAATGTVQVAESFDAFGKRRGSDWQGAPSAADLTAISNSTPDGFTGHEMLDGVGLIHMNGRVYDPTVGRFLSVDPIVRDIDASQSWNGYGYVEGRTLSATDPSGWSTVDNLKKNTQHRADPPRSAWVTSVYGTFHQSLGSRINADGSEEIVISGYWSFSNPYSLVGLREPSLRVGEYPAPSRLANEDAESASTAPQSPQDPCGSVITTYPSRSRELATPAPGTGQGDPDYGTRPGGHWGLDLANPAHAPVVAPGNGVIFRQDFRDPGYGGQVIIDHGAGVYSMSGHLESFASTRGSHVHAGDSIGRTAVPGVRPGSGNLGRGMSPHVHFEIRLGSPLAHSVGGNPIDPKLCLQGN